MRERLRRGAGAAVALVLLVACAGPGAGTTVFWLFAHPDDEALAAGGQLHTEAGSVAERHVVVFATDGEATEVGARLGLGPDEVAAARRAEARAALDHVDVAEVRFAGLPDGALREGEVAALIDELVAAADGTAAFHGHSPLDDYGDGRECGHPDHCAVGLALVAAWDDGRIDEPVLWRVGHLFGGPRGGTCAALDDEQHATKQAMRAEYEHTDPDEGRYGIAGMSVPQAWAATESEPECRDEAGDALTAGR